MERLGKQYVMPCTLTPSGDFLLLESFRSVGITSKNSVHVNLCAGLAGNCFSFPGIKVRGGMFERFGKTVVDTVLNARNPIYFSINNTMCVVEVRGTYRLDDLTWSDDTTVVFYSVVDSISVKGKLYAVFVPDERYNKVGISSFSIDGFSYLTFKQPKTYDRAVLLSLIDNVSTKKDFYYARVGGFQDGAEGIS